MTEPLTHKVEEAAQQLRLSRAKTFELIKTNQIESIKIGRSRRIPHDALVAYVDGLRAAQRPSEAGATPP